MGRASKYVVRSVIRLVWAKSVRGLTVLLLGGVLITMLVRAVEGQGTKDPTLQPGPPLVTDGESSGARSLDGAEVAMAPRWRGDRAPAAEASYIVRLPAGSAASAAIDAAFLRYDDMWKWFKAPPLHDSSGVATRTRQFLGQPRTWGRVPLPADIKRDLGDVDVFVMTGGGNARMMRGVKGTRFYDLPMQLNQLAEDVGLRCTPGNVARVVRAYTFFLAVAQRLRLHESFEEKVGHWDTAALIDSFFDGTKPLVPPYRVRVLDVIVSSYKGRGAKLSTYRGSIGRVRAVVDWGDLVDTTSVEFASYDGFPGRSFPETWSWGTYFDRPGLRLEGPRRPERRGDLGPVEFKVDHVNSSQVRIVTRGQQGTHQDSAAYAVVRDMTRGTEVTPCPTFQFSAKNVPDYGQYCTYVRLVP